MSLVSRALRVLNKTVFLKGSAHEGRDRILRSVRLWTARPCGAGTDPEAAPFSRHKHSPVRWRRLRDSRWRPARFLKESDRSLSNERRDRRLFQL